MKSWKNLWLKGHVTCVRAGHTKSHDLAMFNGHKHCGSGDVMILVCSQILQDHVTKGLGNFVGIKPSKLFTILPSSVAIGTEVVEIL